MPGRSFNSTNYRFSFNGMEKNPELETGNYDFGARMYDGRIGRWWAVDPLAHIYPSNTTYGYVRNNPILRVDVDGRWDIEVHVYKKREKYGYGIAIVKNRSGKEVYRFKVRVEGTGGTNRLVTNSNTPNGVYAIPDENMWMSGGSRKSYGPNHRLILDGKSGEIVTSGRSNIRIHGGRQETYSNGEWSEIENPELKKTHGCLRCYDEDISEVKKITDLLEANDPLEKGGDLTMIEDLKQESLGGAYYLDSDKDAYKNRVQEINSSFKKSQERIYERYKVLKNIDKGKARKYFRASNNRIRKEKSRKLRQASTNFDKKKIN